MSADSKKPPRSPDAFEISKKYPRVLFSMEELAVKNESGLSVNPLKITWLEGQPEAVPAASQSGLFISSQGSLSNERDYETIVMMRMRQAAERQKLIEQMQREDDDEAAKS